MAKRAREDRLCLDQHRARDRLHHAATLADVKHTLPGTAARPWQNFIYLHLNRVIKQHDLVMKYVSGPRHRRPGRLGQHACSPEYLHSNSK